MHIFLQMHVAWLDKVMGFQPEGIVHDFKNTVIEPINKMIFT